MRSLRITAMLGLVAMPGFAAAQPALGVSGQIELAQHENLLQTVEAPETKLAPFTTDGCSGGMSDVWRFIAENFPAFSDVHQNAPPWEPCCVTHDRAYHNAGSAIDAEGSYAARLDADQRLRACVSQVSMDRAEALAQVYDTSQATVQIAYDAIAEAIFRAVRVGGAPCTGLSWRWGYGYPQCE